jgi:hypothetical protein
VIPTMDGVSACARKGSSLKVNRWAFPTITVQYHYSGNFLTAHRMSTQTMGELMLQTKANIFVFVETAVHRLSVWGVTLPEQHVKQHEIYLKKWGAHDARMWLIDFFFKELQKEIDSRDEILSKHLVSGRVHFSFSCC